MASGAFVMRRLQAMAEYADVEVIQPIPYFPVIRPLPGWARRGWHPVREQVVRHAPMLYLPGLMKRWDGRFLERAIIGHLSSDSRERAIDVVDAHFGYPDGVGAVRASARLGLHSFVTIRGLEADYVRDPAIGPQLIEAISKATGCISVSHSLKKLVVDCGVLSEHVEVIPNAVDRSIFFPAGKQSARDRLGLRQDAPLIVSVGTMIALKRHHVVIEALARLRVTVPGARLVIIGTERDEPGYLPRLRQLAEELKVAGAVDFVGAVAPAEVAHWLTSADVFCLVSSREGCCNAVLEALACGRPVVATAVGDNALYVADGANGFLVPADDPAATSRALQSALDSGQWDAHRIAGGLPVRDWDDVGKRVTEHFEARLARCRNRNERSAKPAS
jgi:teichuronic acid biosynthesis glycosyltransferase TuaC